MRCRGPIAVCAATVLLLCGCGGKSSPDPLATTAGKQAPTAGNADQPKGTPAFGVNLGPMALLAPHTAEQVAADTERAGGTILRLSVAWFDAEPFPPAAGVPAKFTFAQFAPIKAAMARHGIRPLILVLGTPNWALPQPWTCPGPGNCDGAPAPAHMNDLSAFIGAALKAFPDAVGVEMYNEPNNAQNWGPVPVNVKAYAKVLAVAHAAIRAQHSNVPLITAGLVNYPQGHQGDLDAPQFLEELYKDGAKGSFEAIGLHPYASTSDPSGGKSLWLSRIRAARQVARRNGDAGRAIWITESGYPTGGPPAWTTVVSEDKQSVLERCEYQLLFGDPDIRVVLHNYLYDYKAPGDNTSLEDHWGLFRQDGSQKPIVAAMAQMLTRPSRVTDCAAVR